MGFAQVIDARPEKLSQHVFVLRHGTPGCQGVRILAAQDDALGISLVIGGVMWLQIVVAGDVQEVREPRRVRRLNIRQRLRHRTCSVERLHRANELARHWRQQIGVEHSGFQPVPSARMPERVARIIDFIPDAPQYDRRMIAVAKHHVLNVPRGPLVEDFVIAVGTRFAGVPSLNPLVLARGPLVERLVHYQESQTITEIV